MEAGGEPIAGAGGDAGEIGGASMSGTRKNGSVDRRRALVARMKAITASMTETSYVFFRVERPWH
jgi:hypothetical protein